MALHWKGKDAFLDTLAYSFSMPDCIHDTRRLAMATNRSRKTMLQQVVEVNSGTDSVEEVGGVQDLSKDPWTILDVLDRVGEELPRRGSDGSLPAWGEMDFRVMTAEQQTVYLVGSLTKVAVEGACALESPGSDYEETLMTFASLLHDLDKGVHVPLDLKEQREQELMDKLYHLSGELNGTRQEILRAAENNISALAVELKTAR